MFGSDKDTPTIFMAMLNWNWCCTLHTVKELGDSYQELFYQEFLSLEEALFRKLYMVQLPGKIEHFVSVFSGTWWLDTMIFGDFIWKSYWSLLLKSWSPAYVSCLCDLCAFCLCFCFSWSQACDPQTWKGYWIANSIYLKLVEPESLAHIDIQLI